MFFISEGMNKGGDSSKIGGRIIKKKHVGSHDPQPDFHIRPGCFLCGEKLSRKVSPPLLPSLPSFQPFLKKCTYTRFSNVFLTG